MAYSSGRCDGSTIYFDLMRFLHQGIVTPARRPGTFKNLKNNIWLYINSNLTPGFLLTERQSQRQPGNRPDELKVDVRWDIDLTCRAQKCGLS
jgi:hypothetical protein